MNLGKIAYEAYCKQSDYKSLVTGKPLPIYEAQSPAIIEAWEAAAQAVAEEIRNATSQG